VLSEPCWIVTYHTALTQTQPVVDPGGQSQSAWSFAPYWRCSSPPIKQRRCSRLSFKPLSFGLDKSSPFGRFAQVVFPP